MIPKLLTFELNYYRKQIVFWLAFAYACFAGSIILTNVPNLVYHHNSPYSIIDAILKFSVIGTIFITGFLGASTLLRDSENKFESLIFTTPIDKFQYLGTKYLGLFTSVFIIHFVLIIAMILSTFRIDADLKGAFNLFHYIYGILIIIFPNVLLATSIIFSAALLQRKIISIYIVTLLVFLLYVIASMLGNSPIMAMSTPFTQEGGGLSSLLDPYAIIPFFEQTSYWSIEDKNSLLPALKGSLLYNRLIWLTIAISVFVFTYMRFEFKVKHEKQSKVIDPPLENKLASLYKAVTVQKLSSVFNVRVFLSKLSIEYISVIKGLSFIVIMILVVGFNLITLYEQITRGPVDQIPYYALTELILELLQDPLSKIGLFIAIFYAVELYWNEKSRKFDMIIDSTPIRNSMFFLSKFAAVISVCFTVILVSILTAIIFQILNGYFDIKPLLYLRLFYYSGSVLILHAGLTLFFQRFAPNKAVGLALGISIVFYPQILNLIEIASPITVFSYNPYFIFSDMANTIYHDTAFMWITIYWTAFIGITSTIAVKFWRRGSSNISENLAPIAKSLGVLFLLIFIGSGSYLYTQYYVLNAHTTRDERIAYKVYYEKTYSKFKDLNQPTITEFDVNVDIYPEERRYVAVGSMVFKNKSDKPIQKLMISLQQVNTLIYSVDVPNATLESKNDRDQVLWYTLNTPLAPNDSSTLSYSIDITRTAFSDLDGENYVTAGGSYFELEDYLPFFGYLDTYELRTTELRKENGLPELSYADPEGVDVIYSDNWIYFSANISTSSDQTAVTVGNLIKEEVKNDRRYFYYKTDQKISRVFPITSAVFTEFKTTYNGVDIEIYHSPDHDKDTERFVEALQYSLDYFQENFVPYTFKNFKIVELPYFSSEQSFGAAFPGMYGGVENRFFNLNHEGTSRNHSLHGVVHEFSHQYWGGYISPNPIGGFSMLTEVLSKYSELVVQEKIYGKYSNNGSLNQMISIYLRNRTRSSNIEKPLSTVGFEPMIYYMKGLHSMTALRALIGEEKINLALRNLLKKYRYPNRPTSLHLLEEYYAVADSIHHPIIRDLFERVVTHDFKINSVNVVEDQGQFKITLDVTTIKQVLNQETDKTDEEIINDEIEIGFYSGYPDVENQNMTDIKMVKFNQRESTITLTTEKKPAYIVIDPNKYRIDPSLADNIIKVQN